MGDVEGKREEVARWAVAGKYESSACCPSSTSAVAANPRIACPPSTSPLHAEASTTSLNFRTSSRPPSKLVQRPSFSSMKGGTHGAWARGWHLAWHGTEWHGAGRSTVLLRSSSYISPPMASSPQSLHACQAESGCQQGCRGSLQSCKISTTAHWTATTVIRLAGRLKSWCGPRCLSTVERHVVWCNSSQTR